MKKFKRQAGSFIYLEIYLINCIDAVSMSDIAKDKNKAHNTRN